VSDWRDDDHEDEWGGAAPGGEGVRIVGPDPAGRPRRPPAEPSPPAGGRFPLPDDGPSWSAGAPPPREGGSSQLPPWTDPPTGEVPRALGRDNVNEDFETWSSLSGPGRPRFRTDSSDWNMGDFAEGELAHDDGTMIGALSEEDPYEGGYGPPPRGGRPRRGRGPRPPRGPDGGGGLEGPPSAGELGLDRGDSDADLMPRVITGVVMAVVALIAFIAGRPIVAFLITVVVGVCAFELYEAFRRAGYHPATVIGLLGCVAIVPVAYNEGERGMVMVCVLVAAFTFLWYLFEVVHARPTMNIGLTFLVFGYVGILGAFGGLLVAPPHVGTGFLGGVVICAVGSDVVGYFAGRSLGNTPLLPRISPHKTIEGLIAGGIAAIVLGGLVGALLHPWATKGVGGGLALGFIVAVTAPLGDLVESMLKRDLRVKDLGGFLPGHGGFLDRFDALLFSLPAAYYLALYIFFH
jgi:phosphatidate cytidylyltransferase